MTHDETTIITGALDMTEKTAKDAMTPISKAFSLDLDAVLNLWVCGSCSPLPLSVSTLLVPHSVSYSIHCRETLNAIMTIGHSRVPVYAGSPTNIIGLILVTSFLYKFTRIPY